MRVMALIFIAIFYSNLLSNEHIDFNGAVGTFYQQNLSSNSRNKDKNISDIRGEFLIKYDDEYKSIIDIDYLYDPKDTNRRYIYIKEAKVNLSYDDYDINFGQMIEFWGALEVYNITDTFNPSMIIKDPLSKEKLGNLGAEYIRYFDDSELSFTLKFLESKVDFPYSNSIYYFFPKDTHLKTDLTQISLYRPTLFMKYNATYEDDFTFDYAFMIQNGYDFQKKTYFDSTINTLNTSLYYATKISTFDTLMYDGWLVKLESSLTYSEDLDISHYLHSGLGVEYGYDSIFGGDNSLILIGEYYRYIQLSHSLLNELDLFQIYQNDIFIGGRFAFNDVGDSSLTLGMLIDVEYTESLATIVYSTRLNDESKLILKAVSINPSKISNISQQRDTLFRYLGSLNIFSFELKYSY